MDSSTIEIANNWRQVKFSDIIDIKGGGTPNTSKQEYWDGNIPFFSPKDVTSSCYVLDTERKITDAGLKKCNSLLYPQNTVFITARGTVGKIVMAGCAMAMNQTNYALIGRDDCGQFTVYHIALQIVEQLKKKANGAVFDAITTRDFNTEDLLLPSLSKMREFNEMVSPIYNYIHNTSIQNQKLIQLRDTLLPKLMSGELSVEEAELQL